MNYALIKTVDVANGPGIRTSLFVSGCDHHCKGCFNEVAWDFNYGTEFNDDIIIYILKTMESKHVTGFTCLGGEPMDIRNQEWVYKVLKAIKEKYPSKSLWIYSGYTYENDIFDENGRAHCEYTKDILNMIDVLVDGPFMLDLKDISLRFRGSSNQRLIDMKETLKNKSVVLWNGK